LEENIMTTEKAGVEPILVSTEDVAFNYLQVTLPFSVRSSVYSTDDPQERKLREQLTRIRSYKIEGARRTRLTRYGEDPDNFLILEPPEGESIARTDVTYKWDVITEPKHVKPINLTAKLLIYGELKTVVDHMKKQICSFPEESNREYSLSLNGGKEVQFTIPEIERTATIQKMILKKSENPCPNKVLASGQLIFLTRTWTPRTATLIISVKGEDRETFIATYSVDSTKWDRTPPPQPTELPNPILESEPSGRNGIVTVTAKSDLKLKEINVSSASGFSSANYKFLIRDKGTSEWKAFDYIHPNGSYLSSATRYMNNKGTFESMVVVEWENTSKVSNILTIMVSDQPIPTVPTPVLTVEKSSVSPGESYKLSETALTQYASSYSRTVEAYRFLESCGDDSWDVVAAGKSNACLLSNSATGTYLYRVDVQFEGQEYLSDQKIVYVNWTEPIPFLACPSKVKSGEPFNMTARNVGGGTIDFFEFQIRSSRSDTWNAPVVNSGRIIEAHYNVTQKLDEGEYQARVIAYNPGGSYVSSAHSIKVYRFSPPRLAVVDPGHGDWEPGAIGVGGLKEKDINLAISLKVAEALRARGMLVLLTRATDVFVTLDDRASIAKDSLADLFISIHANSLDSRDPNVNGFRIYYYLKGQEESVEGKSLSTTILNNVIAKGLYKVGKETQLIGGNKAVLRNTTMIPATLIETGFITGNIDAKNLNDPSWQQRMAETIADGVVTYFPI
jgi:N-acetylmuramoyl-L-alanine amidase